MNRIRICFAAVHAAIFLTLPARAGYQAITIHGEDDPTAVATFVTKFEGELHTLDITVEDASVELDVMTEEPTNGLWDIESTRPNGASFRLADASANQDHASRFSFRQITSGGGGGGSGGGNKHYDAIAQQIQIFASYPGEPEVETPRPTRQGEDYYGIIFHENPVKPVRIRLVYNREQQDEFYPSTISLEIASGLKIINRPPGQDNAHSIAASLLPGTEVTFYVVHDKDRMPVLEDPQRVKLILTDQYGEIHEDEVSLGPVDLDFIKPGTEQDETPEEIAEDKEDTEGEVLNLNWDDDDNSEGNGGHAKLTFKNDFDDAEGTDGENDLIQLKLHGSGIPGFKARLKFDSAYVKIWKKPDRMDEVKTEETLLDLTEEKILYLEGIKITDAEVATKIEKHYKLPAQAGFKLGDTVSAHVATPVITLAGKKDTDKHYRSQNLAEKLHDKKLALGSLRRDERGNTVILKGKEQGTNNTLWYSVDMFDLNPMPDPVGDRRRKPIIQSRQPKGDKEMKMALSVEGAHVFYTGHSNYGIGPNFEQNPVTFDDYMNISSRGLACVDYEDLIGNHGDANVAIRTGDYAGTVSNYEVDATDLQRFIGEYPNGNFVSVADVFHFQTSSPPGHGFHYKTKGSDAGVTNYQMIINSTGDLPMLRYASCFMASCNSGRHYSESLSQKVLLFSMQSTYSKIGGEDGRFPGDWYSNDKSWLMSHYVEKLVDGQSWTSIVSYLNANQSWTWSDKNPRVRPTDEGFDQNVHMKNKYYRYRYDSN